METIFKTLYGTISASSNTISFTDDLIIDSTIIDTYFSDDEIVVDDIAVDNHTVTITIKDHSASVGIAVFINNCDEFVPFDDTEIQEKLNDLEYADFELDEWIGIVKRDLSAEISEKQDKLPIVINDRYLHTNASTGTLEWSTVQGGSGATDYLDLNNKPSINNITLSGNKTLTELGITSLTQFNELNNKVDTVNVLLESV